MLSSEGTRPWSLNPETGNTNYFKLVAVIYYIQGKVNVPKYRQFVRFSCLDRLSCYAKKSQTEPLLAVQPGPHCPAAQDFLLPSVS